MYYIDTNEENSHENDNGDDDGNDSSSESEISFGEIIIFCIFYGLKSYKL